MSLIHDHSCECSISPLEWFKVLPTQTAVEKAHDVEYQPLTTLRENSPVEFYVPASTDEYLDLNNSTLSVAIQIVKNDGGNCEANNVVGPINDIFNGLWSNVELFLNDRLISHSNNTHGYTSMIRHLIHDSEESSTSERTMQLIYKDTAGSMESVDCKVKNREGLVTGFHIGAEGAVIEAGAGGNNGLHNRYLFTRVSKIVTLIGFLRIDLFEQMRYLPNGISIKLRFHRQKNIYMLMGDAATYKVNVLEANLNMRKVRVSPGVQLGHTEALLKSPAKFPITRKECKVLAIAQGFQSFVKDNIFLGQLPKRVVIGMVENTAFAGQMDRNPYNFQHFNVNFMQMYADGEPILSKPLQIDIGSNKYLEAYHTLFQAHDKLDGEKSCIIKREDWPRGYSLFSFDLTPDYDDDDHYPLIKHGNLRLEINFAGALDKTVNVIIYAEFDNIIEISANRSIQFDYQS